MLGGAVRKLQTLEKQNHGKDSAPSYGRLPFETRLEAVLDRLDSMQLEQEKKRETKELAKE